MLPRFIQKIDESKNYELTWKVKVMIKIKKSTRTSIVQRLAGWIFPEGPTNSNPNIDVTSYTL